MPASYNLDSEISSVSSKGNILKRNGFTKKKLIFTGFSLALLVGICIAITVVAVQNASKPTKRSVTDLLEEVPLIDGHNDLPWQLFTRKSNKLEDVDLNNWPEAHTDIPRLRKGKVGAQDGLHLRLSSALQSDSESENGNPSVTLNCVLFWALYVSCNTQHKDSVRACLDQADVIHRFIRKYNDTFQLATSVQDIRDVFEAGRIASLIGMEGGHCMDSSLATLRMFYDLGVRYMTVTHSCNTPWADNSNIDANITLPQLGLTEFGKDVIREMNRLGMLVDLSHVSKKTMIDSLELSEAPVIFSHSSAYALCNHHRNVQDDVLQLTKEKGGLVMVNFYNDFVTCNDTATLEDVANHIDHIKNLIGADHVGLGGDYDGVERVPVGLEDVSTYPNLFNYLRDNRGWTDADLKKLAGENLLRVFEKAEQVSKDMQSRMGPIETIIPDSALSQIKGCRLINGSFTG